LWFKHRAWIPIAWALSVLNVGATWFAARPGEATHAAVHALLAAAFALGAQHLAARGRVEPSEDLKQALDQNEELQRTIEVMQDQARQLEERVDFAERLLIQQKDSARVDATPKGPGS
jgi:hypothetical protein